MLYSVISPTKKCIFERNFANNIKTNPKTHCLHEKSKKKSKTVTALEPPDGDLTLTESEEPNVLSEKFKSIFFRPEETHDNLGTPETPQIPETPESFATEEQVVQTSNTLNKVKAAGLEKVQTAIV